MIQIKRILAATDFSEHSQNALQYAVAFADEFAAPVYLFHALGHATEVGFTGVPIEQLYENLREQAAGQMEELHATWADYNFPVHCEIRAGTPFVEILRYAKEMSADLIVMGTHGRGLVAHTLMGSVAEKVVRTAPCPVLTVRHPEHEFVMP